MPSASWANGWVTGDIVSAAEYRKSMGSIFDSTLGAAAASIDVTGIVATYAHLLVELYARTDSATNGLDGCSLRFNGDAAANYDYQIANFSAAASSISEAFAQTGINAGLAVGGGSAANLFATTIWEIAHYAGSANNKTVNGQAAGKTGTATTNMSVRDFAGFWRSNAAINRITLFPGTGNFAAGTRCTIYALGA
jgi:hypothetical protein